MIETSNINISRIPQSNLSKVDFDNLPFGKVYSDHMFVADYRDENWGDYRIEPYEFLRISPANATLHYGQSVFEGMKGYKSEDGDALLFRPYDNFERLNKSAVRMCMPELSEDLFMSGLRELIDLDRDWIPSQPGYALYIRPFIFAADEYIGIRPSDNYKFMIFTCPVGTYYNKPVRVKIETKFSRAFEGGTGYAKAAGNYAASLYPAKLAAKKGYDQLIWTDGKEHEYIEEAGTMNLMFVIDGKIVTAPAGETILKGITRDSVLTIARDWGIEVEERKLSVTELIAAIREGRVSEAFGTGTAATIAQISAIGHDEVDYELPDVEGREFSNKVHKELDAIKTGKIADRFDWIVKV